MAPLFIVAYVLFGVIAIIGGIYLYTLNVYTKGTIFTKEKYNTLTFAFYILIILILVIMGALFASVLKKPLEKENWVIHTSLCFSFAFIAILNFLGYILVIWKNNKFKTPYDQIAKTDFKPALENIQKEIGDVEAFKAKLQKKHKKYYEAVNLAYIELLKRAKDEKVSRADKLADIVVFNDTFSHKWCNVANKYQLLLIYQLLTII